MQQPVAERPIAEPSGACLPRTDILLIDACAPARYALRLKLKALGAEVWQAGSAEQAIPALRARRPDLIIAAPVLPGMNALELLELLQSEGSADRPPLVIHGRAADWPLAGAAVARGARIVGTDAELLQRLPELLRPDIGTGLTEPAPDPSPRHRPPPPEPEAPMPEPVTAREPASSCWRLVLAAALVGVLIGASIGWLSRS